MALIYEIFYQKKLSAAVEPRPLCQVLGELTHRLFDARVMGPDGCDLQNTINKVRGRGHWAC
jgi:hypothetical protein